MELIRDTVDLSAFMEEDPAIHKIRPARDWCQDVIDGFYLPDNTPRVRLGWRKCGDDFEFREGEVTLWAGINGHGKTQLVGQVQLDLMTQGEKVCCASLEMAPRRLMQRMSRQAFGSDEPSIQFIKDFHAWTDGKLWLYDHFGSSNPATILAVIRYAVKTFGITHFVIDNLTKVVPGEDSYNDQKNFVNALCTIANDTGIHIHLIVHVRKGKDESEIPNKMSIKGAGSITDMVDNVFIVWRNKPKEKKIREGDMSVINEPDALLILDKQRNGEHEDSYAFWFHPASFQYIEDRLAMPKQYRVGNLR